MKVLKYLLFLVAVIVTGRADVIRESTRRDGNQLPAGEKVVPVAYSSSTHSPNADAQISSEIGERGAYKDYNLNPNGFGDLNEAGESFGAETKAVAGYDGGGQLSGGNIDNEYGLVLPTAGFGYGNQFKATAQASASAEVYTGETAENGGTTQVDATSQAQLGAETQADAIIQQSQGVQYDEGTNAQITSQAVKPFNKLTNHGFNDLVGPIKYTYGPGFVDPLKNPGRVIWPHSTPHQGDTDPWPPVYQYAQPIPTSAPISDTGIEKYKPIANGYEVIKSSNWIKNQNSYNNVNWNPYTQSAQAKSLVQAEGGAQFGGKIEADALAQENGEPQYQKKTKANSMVQTSKGVGAIAANADAEAKTYAGYGGQYNAETPSEVMAHVNSGSQYETSALADAVLQSTGGVQSSGEKKITAQVDTEYQTNAASSYSGGSLHNGGPHYVLGSATKGTAKTSEGIKYGAQYGENALYADTALYNSGSLNGEGFQANAKSHLQSGVQFGGAIGAEVVPLAGTVVESRFGQSTHPPRRPNQGFGYRHPYNGWNHG